MTAYPCVRASRHSTEGATSRLAPWAVPAILVASGSLALALGLLVYITDRAAPSAMLIPAFAMLEIGPVFGVMGQWMPSFVHPFAFSLFTAAVLQPSVAPAYRACLAWWTINIVFELGQHPQINAAIAKALQDAMGATRLTRSLANYFLLGRFDIADLAAATAGTLAAALVLRRVHRLELAHGH